MRIFRIFIEDDILDDDDFSHQFSPKGRAEAFHLLRY